MQFGVYYNKNYINDNRLYLEKIRSFIEQRGFAFREVNNASDLDGLDVLFVLGGDGTILNVAAECAKRSVKIMGINYGHVGFLAEFEQSRLDDALKLVCDGNFKTQKRSMLNISYGGKEFLALNDLVVQRGTCGTDFSNTVEMRAEIDGSLVDNFTADGIIVSTPTGSTAYSLSAGGSVLTPDISAFIMTPICAHSLHSRPVVYSDNSVLDIYAVSAKKQLNIVVDGVVSGSLNAGERIRVQKSRYFVEFISSDKNFFGELLLKLNKWSR